MCRAGAVAITLIAVTAAAAAIPSTAAAHGMRTAYLEIEETALGVAVATWRLTVADEAVAARFADGCAVSPLGAGTANQRALSIDCRDAGGLAGSLLTVEGMGPVVSETVVRVRLAGGAVASQVLLPASPTWRLPSPAATVATALRVAGDYVWLGALHIAGGADHLLFLLALVLVVRRPRAVLLAETAFTLSHSLTLAATALGWIQVFAPAAEACIALSLVLMALDIRADGRPAVMTRWQAPLMAFVFGLVHGLGFAGGLQEMGMPAGAVSVALVGFGLGVELGQIAFLALALAVTWLVARTRWWSTAALATSYLVGVVGTYWLAQRLWICFA